MKLCSIFLLMQVLGWGAAPAMAQDLPSPELTMALQECVEAVNDGVGETEPPSPASCIGVGTNACQQLPGGGSTQGIAACNRLEAEFWDDMLNNAYGNLKDNLDADVFGALKRAQQIWMPWRDAKCRFVYELWKEGSISQIYHSYCLMDETANRAIELIAALDGL